MLSDVAAPRTLALLDYSRLKRFVLATAVALAILALAFPMLTTGPAPLTSDESLYLSEGYNIAAGVGPKYTSQEFVNHRAPLYPALLAIPLRLTGGDPASAYWIPKLIVLALAAATFLLARQLFGTLAGSLAALLVMSSAYLRWLGTTLFLDGTETLLMLLCLAALWRAFQSASARWFALSGTLLGAAFLAKEAAIQWLPLPLAFALLSHEHRNRRIALGLAAYGATAGAVLTGWWLWVYLVTARVYFWGAPDWQLVVWIAIAVAMTTGAGLAWAVFSRLAPRRLPLLARGTGVMLVLVWASLLFVYVELTSWPFPMEHWKTVPRYVWQIAAGNSQPWPLVALGAVWPLALVHRDQRARLLTLGLALFLPFALQVGNRFASYRDVLPMVYIAYIGAAALAAYLLRRAVERAGLLLIGGVVVLGLAAVGIAQTQEFLNERAPYDRAAVRQASWDNPMVHAAAKWIHEELPAGAGIMSGRLYFSHLYVLDKGRHPIYQLPTVRVEPRPGEAPFLERASTLFRWEDHRMGPAHADERWLYLRRYPIKTYYVGLSERDLLRDLRERSVDYLVITGEDAGFSSFTYLDYFEENPAFELVYADRRSRADGIYVFRVDRGKLAPHAYKAVVSSETLAALAQEFDEASPEEVRAAIDPDGIVVRP